MADDIFKKMAALTKLANKFSDPPFAAFVAKEIAAFDAIQRQLEGPFAATIERHRQFELILSKLDVNALRAAARIEDLDERWRRIAGKFDFAAGVSPDPVVSLQAAVKASDRSAPDTVRAEAAVAHALTATSQVLAAANDGRRPLTDRIQLLSLWLATLLPMLLMIFLDYQNGIDDDRRSAAQIEAIQEGHERIASALQELLKQAMGRSADVSIVRRQSPLRVAPSATAARVGELHAGEAVKVLRHAGSWIFVALPSAEARGTLCGWVHIENLAFGFGR